FAVGIEVVAGRVGRIRSARHGVAYQGMGVGGDSAPENGIGGVAGHLLRCAPLVGTEVAQLLVECTVLSDDQYYVLDRRGAARSGRNGALRITLRVYRSGEMDVPRYL